MKKLFLGVLAIAGLVACVQEDVVNTPNLQEEIGFSGYVDGAVRSADPSTTTGSIDHFTVWAYVDDSQGLVLADELVSKSGDVWTYSNVQYWLKKHNYRFFALTPYVANQTNNAVLAGLNDPYANYLGGLSFTNVNGTEDLLYATAEVSTENSIPESVQFAFDHLLSKVKFTFVNGFTTDNIDLAVTNIKMVVPETASTTLGAQVHNGYVWTGHAGELTLDFGHAVEGSRIDATKNGASDNERLTFPAKVDANLTYKVTFTVDQYIGTQTTSAATYNLETTITGVEFEAGKAYNFIANISSETLDLQTIEFDVTVDEWDQETVEHNAYEYIAEDFGIDTITGIYHVESETGLAALAALVNGGNSLEGKTVVLDTDIDLAATRSASNWTPIGTSEKPFLGTFDGKGHTIKNLVLYSAESDFYVGFFGYAKNATIKNVVFENVNVKVGGEDSNDGGHIAAVVGALEGTSTIENVTVEGNVYVEADVTMNNASRVAAVVGGNGYGNVTVKNVHVQAAEGSYVKANNCVGAIAGQLNGVASFENCTANIDVTGTKFFAGGIIGITATKSTFVNCHSTGDVAITAGRAGNANDLHRVGGIAGGWADNTSYPCVLTDCSYTGKLSGKDANGATAALFDCAGYVGRGYSAIADSKVIIDGVEYIYKGNGTFEIDGKLVAVATKAEALAAALTSENENISVVLANDIEAPISSLGQTASGDAKQMGGVDTKTITIDLAGHKLNLTTTYWSVLGAKNSDALVTIKNGTMTSSQTSGTWDSYDLGFVNCNYAFENVVFEKAIALGAANKNYTLKNVTINETHDYYAMWVEAVGQNITIDGLNVVSAGRGIKIDEQYVDAPAKVTLNISNSTFKTAKKAAIVVKSVAGAEINAENLNIAEVAADNTFAVWVDEDAAAHADKVVVNGALCTVEGQGAVVEDASGLSEAIASGATTIALADGSYSMPGVGGKSVTIVGSKDVVITVSKPNMGGGNVTFDGVTVKGSGYSTGVQHVNSVTYNNVTVIDEMCLYGESVVFNNCTFELPSGKYIWTYGCKNSAFNNCVFNTAGKAILVYNEGGTDCHVVVEGCVFNATEGAKAGAIANQNCAAIEIDNYTGRAHNVTTSANVWGDNFSGEWRIKSYAAGNPITVNGVEYTSIAIDGKTMTIDANKNVTVNE